MNIDEIRKARLKIDSSCEKVFRNMDVIRGESLRVADVASHCSEHLDNLEHLFEEKTGLNSIDVKLLFFATSLQLTRWVILALFNRLASEKIQNIRMRDNDPKIKKFEREANDSFSSMFDDEWGRIKEKYPSAKEILYGGAPYDVICGSPLFGVNMEGGAHRVHTLGHDPVLGWIFGVMNILSSTITLDNFRTFMVVNRPKPRRWGAEINLLSAFAMAVESCQEDMYKIPAAVFAQARHLASDAFTKKGLPVPFLEAFSPEIAGKIYKEGFDSLCLVKDIALIGTQAILSIMINSIIASIHGLYYDPRECANRDLYDVKTRKILDYSNAIATSSNLIWVGTNVALENYKVVQDLDIGGLLVTINRLITDVEYIQQIKHEFVYGSFNKMIKGNPLKLEEV